MGFFKRLFTLSLSNKFKKKDRKKDKTRKIGALTSSSTGNLLTTPTLHDQDAVVNRLLRSSSTHFSVLSETEYHSLPPLPHPINNVLRAPSVVTNSTQATNTSNTYTVTVHPRTIHSCTEFPNANGSTPTPLPTKKRSIPPLTPGDKHRLEKLRQDSSVLSLLNIYDDSGHLNSEAFINTPAPRKSRSTTTSFRMLLGEDPNPSSSSAPKIDIDESDLSWADRCIRTARRSSTSSTSTESSLGIATGLFRAELSFDQLHVDDFHADTSASSNDMEVAFDSLDVELGTVEDGSFAVQSTTSGITSRASQFFKFLASADAGKPADVPMPPGASSSLAVPSHLQPVPYLPRGPRPLCTIGRNTVSPAMTIRDGPRESHAQLSPAPRRRQYPPPLPPIPPEFQLKSSQPKAFPFGHRMPASKQLDAESTVVSRNVSDRTVSVASSIHPQIETQDIKYEIDPYTPIPRRSIGEGKRERLLNLGENIPPNAPARPIRVQARSYSKNPDKFNRNKGVFSSQAPLSKNAVNQSTVLTQDEEPVCVAPRTHAKTPVKDFPLSHLQTPSGPSPASSSELSPECRRIMTTVRAQVRVPKVSLTPQPPWQSWDGSLNKPLPTS